MLEKIFGGKDVSQAIAYDDEFIGMNPACLEINDEIL